MYDNYLPDRSMTAIETYLEEDLRFDTDALRDFDANIIKQCAAQGRKKEILNNLVKIVKHKKNFPPPTSTP